MPSFLWIFVGAPYAEALCRVAALTGALAAITAAVVGVILNLTVWFAIHSLFSNVGAWSWSVLRLPLPDPASFDAVAALLAGAAAFGMLRFKWPMLPMLGLCAVAGPFEPSHLAAHCRAWVRLL